MLSFSLFAQNLPEQIKASSKMEKIVMEALFSYGKFY